MSLRPLLKICGYMARFNKYKKTPLPLYDLRNASNGITFFQKLEQFVGRKKPIRKLEINFEQNIKLNLRKSNAYFYCGEIHRLLDDVMIIM